MFLNQSPIIDSQVNLKKPFDSIRNRIRISRQHEELSRIVDIAGALLKKANESSDKVSESELTEIICSITFMMSTLNFLLIKSDRAEMESASVLNIIDRAETMTAIMGSAFIH